MATTTYTLPARKYIVNDPCYNFVHESGTWEKVLRAYYRGDPRASDEDPSPAFLYDGKPLLFFRAEGAECDGWDYPIDSATFGVTPYELVESQRDWLFHEETGVRHGRPYARRTSLLIDTEGKPLEVRRERQWLHVGYYSFDIGEERCW